jgi:hypothetical protein
MWSVARSYLEENWGDPVRSVERLRINEAVHLRIIKQRKRA